MTGARFRGDDGETGPWRHVRAPDADSAFARCLDTIQQRGGGILVSGNVTDAVVQRALRTFLGDENLDRRRVLALLDSNAPDRYLPGSVTAEHDTVRTLDIDVPRSIAESAGHPPSAGGFLQGVRDDVDAAIEALRPSQGYQGGQLRVALVSLQPLVEQADRASLYGWLQRLYADVTADRNRGRLYVVHQESHAEAAVVMDRIPFDVHVKLRREDDHVEQQWVLPPDQYPEVLADRDEPLTTDWMRLWSTRSRAPSTNSTSTTSPRQSR